MKKITDVQEIVSKKAFRAGRKAYNTHAGRNCPYLPGSAEEILWWFGYLFGWKF